MNENLKLLPHQSLSQGRIYEIDYNSPYDLLYQRAQQYPDRIFLISPGLKEESFTYSEFLENIDLTAKYLLKAGIKKDNRINIIIPNSPEFLFFFFAAIKIDATIVPINEDIAPREMLYIINDCQSRAIFYHRTLSFKIDNIKEQLDPSIMLDVIDDLPDFKPLIDIYNSRIKPDNSSMDDEAEIIYTSGTTGNPKGVVLTYFNLLADARAISEWFQFTNETRTLCILPLFHNNGQIVTLLAPLYAGGSTVIIRGKASIMAFWGLAGKYEVTWTSVMTSILSILSSLPGEERIILLKELYAAARF